MGPLTYVVHGSRILPVVGVILEEFFSNLAVAAGAQLGERWVKYFFRMKELEARRKTKKSGLPLRKRRPGRRR